MTQPSIDEPQLHFTQAPGIRLAHFEWHADRRGQGPTVWLVHATGFHARVWDQAVRHLPADRHVVAIEQRCHGRSDPVPFDNWRHFGQDQAAQIDALGLQGALGVGHSMGAHALVQAASLRPGAFRRLILIDPVMSSPDAYQQPPVPLGVPWPPARRTRLPVPLPVATAAAPPLHRSLISLWVHCQAGPPLQCQK